jgi:aryl-alcohol dehydrogenase-like predicted oxidoreductase
VRWAVLDTTDVVSSRADIGLGLAALGRPAYITLDHGRDLGADRSVEALRERTWRVLDAAFEAGIRYFDAARSYGLAEDFLAGWLAERGISPDDVTVGSKWGYRYTGGWRIDADEQEVKDLSVDHLRRQLAETRALLGDHLDLYQIHSATLESGVLEDRHVLDELVRLQESGVRIGFTVTGARQAQTIEWALALDLFDAVQATWNLLERSATEQLERAHAAGLTVVVKEAVANGRLTANGDVEPLKRAAAERGVGPDALALAAVLAQPWADIVLSGAISPEMLRSNLQATEIDYDGSLDEIAEDPKRYWSERSALAWN